MRARILPTDEFAEFGNTNTAILVISINPTEANSIMDELGDVDDASSNSLRLLYGYLQVIAEGLQGIGHSRQDNINTDGRSIPPVPVEPKAKDPKDKVRDSSPANIQGLIPNGD